jgi:hypothetical protein
MKVDNEFQRAPKRSGRAGSDALSEARGPWGLRDPTDDDQGPIPDRPDICT